MAAARVDHKRQLAILRTARERWPFVLEEATLVYDQAGELLALIPRTSSKVVTRTKGYGFRDRLDI